MQRTNWTLILPLAVLFAIGLLGFVMPAWLVGLSKVAKSYGPSELSDQWLGFFGNIIGALIALLAAAIAWTAAQVQIKVARQQSAVVAYQTLSELYATIVEEERIATDLVVLSFQYAEAAKKVLDTGRLNRAVVVAVRDLMEEILTKLCDVEPHLLVLAKRVWGGPEDRAMRLRARAACSDLKAMAATTRDDALSWLVNPQNVALQEAVDLRHRKSEQVYMTFSELRTRLLNENKKIDALLHHNYQNFIDN